MAAAALDAAIIDMGKRWPQGLVGREAVTDIDAAQRRLREAWSRATVLADAEIDRRLHVLDSAMFMAGQELSAPGDPHVTLWPLTVAYRELRAALVAFQRREAPPEAQFPTLEEMFELAHPERGRTAGLQSITDYLVERGITG
jgi:hypothetical protein